MTLTFRSGLSCHDIDRKTFAMMTTLPLETPGYVVTLFAATLCEDNPDSKTKLWSIISSKRNILHMQVLLRCRFI